MQMNFNRDRRRVEYFQRRALALAGGKGSNGKDKENASGKGGSKANSAVPARRRKVRVPMVEGDDSSPSLELVVDNGVVYIVSLLLHSAGYPLELTLHVFD